MFIPSLHSSFLVFLFKVGKHSSGGVEERCEKMGLTPDWIIHKGAFDVFNLEVDTSLPFRNIKTCYTSGQLFDRQGFKVVDNLTIFY